MALPPGIRHDLVGGLEVWNLELWNMFIFPYIVIE